jgi:hypothetical protein
MAQPKREGFTQPATFKSQRSARTGSKETRPTRPHLAHAIRQKRPDRMCLRSYDYFRIINSGLEYF